MTQLTEWLTKPLLEGIDLPIEIGDTVKMGRFKNKKVVVKSIDWNEKGDLLINGRPALKFRLIPKSEQVEECIALAKKFDGGVVLGKNRDRNYTPNIKVVRELTGYGVELCYVVDQDTDWSEGMNSYGIGLVNSALFVKRDEKDFDKSKKKKAMSKDGEKIREALGKKTLKDVVDSLVKFKEGVKGHTIVSDGKKVVVIENTSRTKPSVKIHDINKEVVVRTNHGLEHPEQGYTSGPDKLSSQLRMKNAMDVLNSEKDYKKMFPRFYNHTQSKGAKYDLVRAQNKLWTSSQVLMNLNTKEIILYLIPGAVKFLGIENTLPKDYKSKLHLNIRQYEHSPSDKYDTFVTTDAQPKKSAIKDTGVVSENKIALRVPGDIKGLYKLFKKNKKQLYIVGGAVRDAILGKSPKDFDLATDAKPDEVLAIAKQGGFKTYEVGKSFGVVVVGGHEIATFRKDIGKGRRPTAVDFSDIQGDVNRRDLTINSLFYDIERNEVVDLTGGLKDLKAKIIKTVGNPNRRFEEDPLRKLRALRFQAVVGGKMDKQTEMALLKNPSLSGVSGERIREEFVKAIQKGKSSKQFMESCDKFGFTKQIFSGLKLQKPYPNVKDHILFLSFILRKNEVIKLGKQLNSLKYSAKESNNIQFLVYLNNFKPENIYMVKKAQEKTSLSPKQIVQYGKMIGKDFKKLSTFKLSVKGGGEQFIGLKGKQIGDKIRDLEKKKFLGEIAVPSPSRKGINKNKTDRMSGYEKVEEILTEVDISPSHILMLRTMYASVKMINPSGNAYKNLISYLDNMTRRNLQKISRAKIKWLSPLAKNRLKFSENLKKTLDLYSKNVVYSISEKGDFISITEDKKWTKDKIKKVVGIYGGRFQPFGPHHLKTFRWLEKQVDVAYITTSNIKRLPKHPMNFKEKVRHMVKMGVPANKIIFEKSPYRAASTLKKFDPDTTAVVYIFGKKDAGRLTGGKYFMDYKYAKKRDDMVGWRQNGYVLAAPHISMSVGGKEISGTTMRNVLGSPKIDDKQREKLFKKLFRYFNQGNFNMMTNKFKKLFEFYNKPSVKDIIKEVSALGVHFDAKILDDEGLYDFFNDFDTYKRVSPKHAEILGWEVIGDIVNYDRATDPGYDFQYVQDRVDTVTFGKTINQDTSNEDSVDNPYPKYRKHMKQMADKMGWEIVKFFGKPTAKVKDSTTFDMKDITKGVEKIKKLQENYQEDVELFIEAACGVGQNPADTGCTPENPSTTKPKFKMPKFKMPKIKTLADIEKERKEKERKRKRPDRKPNIVNGVDVIKDKKDEQHFIDDFHLKGDKGVDQYEYDKKMQDQYAKQVKKLTPKQRKQQRKDILSWKQLGGYEAIERAVADGTHTREEIRERNERISEVSHNTVTNVDRPIERGISVPAEAADQILKDFVIGEMVEIPDEAGHGSSGFSTSADTARGFARVDDPDSEQTSILFRIKPNSNGQVRGVFIDGESDEDGGHWGEAEITRSSKSKAKVMTVETKKLPSGKIVKIITLQEPDDLSEVVVREEKEKENILSKKYLEGPLNPKPQKKKKKFKKEQIDITKDTKELLLMGGAYGHMSHPFDDNNLTFSDLKQIIINGLGGTLDREDGVTEKLDGQNLMVSWVDGKLRAARNKGHLKNHGKTAPTTSGIKSMFSGRGEIEKAFVGAMKSLEKAIGSLNDKQKEKVFGNGSKWMNLEVMYPKTANVVDYDIAEIVFHGTLEYDESGKPIGQPKDSARMLAGMITQTNNHIQKMFRIGKPNFLTVPKHQNFGKMKNKFLGQLKKLQSQYGLKDNNRLGEYHEAYWREYVFNASKQFRVSLKPNQFVSLVNRWAFFDKSYKVRDIKKDFKDSPKFLDWILSTDKMNLQAMFKKNIKPFEVLFFGVGAEILKNIQGYMAASPNIAVQKMRKEVISAMRDLQKPDNVHKLKKLKIQIEKLSAIGGLDSIVPSEGIVFKYKGKIYKFTGAFAPINQILGSLKFG